MANKGSLAQRVKAGDRAAIKQVLANPAWRHLVSDADLKKRDPKAYAQRQLNTRLRAPITPGSSITERDLAQQSRAEQAVKYGPLEAQQQRQLGEAQTWQRDIGSYYDQYQQQLAQRQQAVQDISNQTSQQLQGTLAGVTGLAGADLNQLQGQANQGAAQRGVAPAADLSQMASNAAATRQALLGSFAAQQAVKDQANTIYTSGLANTVAPAQKLQAVAQAQGRIRQAGEAQAQTAREKAASDVAFRASTRESEQKNLLAQSIAAGKDLTAAGQLKETVRSHKASERLTGKKIAADATQKAADAAVKAADKAAKAHQPNKYGVPADQWATWSTSHRQRAIEAFTQKTRSGKPQTAAQQFEAKYGVKPAGQAAVSKAQSSISEAKTWLRRIGGNLDQAGQVLTAGQAKGKGKDEPAIPKLPAVFVRVAMDQARNDGYITPATADRLHRAGYSVATLGLKTRSLTQRNTGTYRGSRAPQPQGHY
jgi:hypothetical protein